MKQYHFRKYVLLVCCAISLITASILLTVSAQASMLSEHTGNAHATATVNTVQKILRMPIEATQQLTVSGTSANGSKITAFAYKSGAAKVATVSDTGLITAVGVGTATITVSDKATGTWTTVRVDVYDPATEAETEEEFRISVFWGPTWDYTTPEQYDLLADAKINWVMMPGDSKLNTEEGIFKASALCYERGIHLIGIGGGVSGSSTTTAKDWEKFRSTYQYCAGLGGIFIADEPMNPNPFADDYRMCQEVWPGFYSHLNFLPSSVYGSSTEYQKRMDDFVNLVGSDNYQYLMFDRYPFGGSSGSFDTGLYQNLDDLRLVGLRNNVKTAAYVQSISNGVMRRPTGDEIRFNVNTCLAYGVKMFRYFTWFQPTGQAETFSPAIVDANGKKTDLYDDVKTINTQVMNWGPTLMKVDALEVYHGNGEGTKLPKDTFVSLSDGKKVILSFMRDRTTGRNYLMVVNKQFNKSQKVTLNFIKDIQSLDEVSYHDGKVYTVDLENNSVTVTFEPGEARLYVLPENFDFYTHAATPQKGENLAAGKQAFGTGSEGEPGEGLFLWNLTDGVTAQVTGNNGWKFVGSKSNQEVYVGVNLGAIRTVNRVDLFPSGSGDEYGANFPSTFDIEVSKDGKTWKTVLSFVNYQTALPTFTFADEQAQYVRLHITEMRLIGNTRQAGLAEIQVFENDGHACEIVPFTQILKDLIQNIQAANTSMAQADKQAALDTAIEHAQALLNQDNPDYSDISKAVEEVRDSFNNLLTQTQKAIQTAIETVEGSDEATRFNMEIIVAEAKEVFYKVDATEEELNAVLTRLNNGFLAQYTAEELTLNIALNKYNPKIIYSSCLWESYEQYGWSWKFINDGTGNLWSSALTIENPKTQAWIGYEFETPQIISRVVIVPRGEGIDFPTIWKLEYSQDGNEWFVITEEKKCDNKGENVELTFTPVVAKFIRFFGARLKNGGDGYAMQLTEFEVYRGTGTESELISTETIRAALQAAESTDTAPYSTESVSRLQNAITRAKALLENEIADSLSVHNVIADLNWAVSHMTFPEPETEAPTEPETVAETEPSDEAQTETDTKTADTEPIAESETEFETKADTGCQSVVIGITVLVTLIAAAFILAEKQHILIKQRKH